MIIVLIQVVYLLGKFVFHRYHNIHSSSKKSSKSIMNQKVNDESNKNPSVQPNAIKEVTNLKRRYSNDSLDEEAASSIKFKPPAYIQRYEKVLNVLNNSRYAGKLKKIVDFGCSELGFGIYVKHTLSIEEALFVDIDRKVLEMNKNKLKPLNVDYLHTRTIPYICRILEGSVTDHDKLLENCDAVVCIELIEHLYPEPLTMLPFNIFGFIRPKVVVITTPNADFNVLFTNLSGFRHPDHKFEWTRKQFQDWAHNIVSRYPEYEVTIHGICYGPSDTEHLGACSQMAVFHKHSDILVDKIPNSVDIFKCVTVYEYPFKVDNRSDEEKILDDAVYYIRKFSYNDEDTIEQLPLHKLLNLMRSHYISLNDLKEILENAQWTIVDQEDGPAVVVPQPSFSDYSFNEDDFWDNDYPANQESDEEAGPPLQYFSSHNADNSGYNENWDDGSNDEIELDINAENVANLDKEWEDVSDRTESNVIMESEAPEQAQYNGSGDIDYNNYSRDYINEAWEDVPDRNESNVPMINDTTENSSFNTETADSTPSIHPDDVCLDDIVTESRSTEFVNSTLDESILMSSFSETKGSENSETAKIPTCQIAQTSSINSESKINQKNSSHLSHQNSENYSTDTSHNGNSMCSIFLEPSRLSKDLNLEDLTDPNLESIITSPLESKSCKKLKLNNSSSLSNLNENTFEKPNFTSSPHVPTKFIFEKRKNAKQKTIFSSSNCSNEDSVVCKNDTSTNALENNDNKLENSNNSSNESVIAESKLSYSPQIYNSENLEKVIHYTGTIPKHFNRKLLDMKINCQIEQKLERISPNTLNSPPHSWSPEIMDSGYPDSNSPPDLSPEYDLSSIANDHTSDSGSPSIANPLRIDFLAEIENRDLANNNLDPEGNNMEAEDNQHINDFHPLINVLENDLQNENDIYDVHNAFPLWLLRLLQRFDADAVEINMPMLQLQN